MQYTKEQRHNISVDYQRAVRNCNVRAWEKMTSQEKLADMQKIENYNAMQQNRLPSEVTMEKMDVDTYGYQTGNTIVHNEDKINSSDYKEAVNTNYHEGFHSYVRQSEWFSEVDSQFAKEYTQEGADAIRSPIPDSKENPLGYYNHPQEQLAREEGEKGLEQMCKDQEIIQQIDAQQTHQNQILETFDYDALSMEEQSYGTYDGMQGTMAMEQPGGEYGAYESDSSYDAENDNGSNDMGDSSDFGFGDD